MAAAVSVPYLVAYNVAPSATALNQLSAILGWGIATIALVGRNRASNADDATRDERALGFAIMAAACLAVGIALAAIGSLRSSALALVALSIVVGALGASSARRTESAIQGFVLGLIIAGLCSALIGVVQVTWPGLPDGDLVARSGRPGLAVGNVRQPNHLASLLLLATIAFVAVQPRLHRWGRGPVFAAFALLIAGITFSGSRTGLLGMALLAAWAALDRRLDRQQRTLLAIAPVIGLLAWGVHEGLAAMSSRRMAPIAFERFGQGGDISSSRFAIWRNALDLITAHPWTGVGWGNFNLAWTMTPFPDRPTAFFDHSHNLVVELVVELGVPWGATIVTLLLVSLVHAGRQAWRAQGESAVLVRALFVMLLMMALHSMLEYPLWYAHFLLPVAFAWGACLGWPQEADACVTGPVAPPVRRFSWLGVAGVAMCVASIATTFDYLRVSRIFDAHNDALSLDQRLEEGRVSPFFAHHAEYAIATTTPFPGAAMPSFDIAKHHLLDTRFMIAWAQAYAAIGDLDKARYIAARLREFKNRQSREFFAPCDASPASVTQPFQCEAPQRALTWRDFLGPQTAPG